MDSCFGEVAENGSGGFSLRRRKIDVFGKIVVVFVGQDAVKAVLGFPARYRRTGDAQHAEEKGNKFFHIYHCVLFMISFVLSYHNSAFFSIPNRHFLTATAFTFLIKVFGV